MFFNIMPLTGTNSYSVYLIEPLQLNLDNEIGHKYLFI